jgi:hypothetical protein
MKTISTFNILGIFCAILAVVIFFQGIRAAESVWQTLFVIGFSVWWFFVGVTTFHTK